MQIKELIKKSFDECCNVVFPKICLHCKEKISSNFFCESCLSSFDLLEAKDVKIFSNISCSIIAAFDDIGAINTFFLEFKKMAIPVFAKLGASYMVLQYLKSSQPLPDMVVPLSEGVFGVQYTEILAKEVATLLERPVKKMFFQARFAMLQNTLFMKSSALQDKSLLVVMDKLDEKKMSRALDILEKQNFKNISILALCQ
jgi:hypothetical protein